MCTQLARTLLQQSTSSKYEQSVIFHVATSSRGWCRCAFAALALYCPLYLLRRLPGTPPAFRYNTVAHAATSSLQPPQPGNGARTLPNGLDRKAPRASNMPASSSYQVVPTPANANPNPKPRWAGVPSVEYACMHRVNSAFGPRTKTFFDSFLLSPGALCLEPRLHCAPCIGCDVHSLLTCLRQRVFSGYRELMTSTSFVPICNACLTEIEGGTQGFLLSCGHFICRGELPAGSLRLAIVR